MKSEETVAAEQALEEKLAGIGIRRGGTATLEQPPPEQAPPEPVEEQPAEPAEAPPVEPEAPPEQPAGDPAIAAYLAKYGGDVDKALQAAVAAQRKLGELGNELGQQRQENAEYQQILTEIEALKQQRQQPPMPVDWIDEQIAANPASAREYAVQALNSNQPLLYERIMRQWYETDPYAAQDFQSALRVEQVKRELQAQAPQRDEGIQMQAALQQVLAEHPEFTQYADGLEAVITKYPAAAAGLRGGQQEKQQAIETLFALAERDTLRAIALAGGPAAEPATAQEVATGTTSQEHPHEAPAPPTPQDVFREQFRQEAARRNGERPIPQAFVAR